MRNVKYLFKWSLDYPISASKRISGTGWNKLNVIRNFLAGKRRQ